MKIGIITFHRAVNYGAILQLWALYTYLRCMGHNVYVIDYRCSKIERVYKNISLEVWKDKNLKGKIDYFLSHIINFSNIRKRNIKFSCFIQQEFCLLPVSKIPILDIVIAGSDQIWNPHLTDGLDEFYTLQNSLFDEVKKIGYAISGEPSYFSHDVTKQLGEIINTFNYFSVREDNLCKLFQQYTNTKIYTCVDPTLLLSYESWVSLGANNILNEKYVFVYQVVPSSLTMKVANCIAKHKRLKLVYLNSKYSIRWNENNIKKTIGPMEFVSLIKFADFVVTTSFHGTALSIVMKKQFVVIETGKMNRQKELLDMFSLNDRVIKSYSDIQDRFYQINYDNINVNRVSLMSQQFLKDSCHV